MPANYDVNEVIRQFIQGRTPGRTELFKEMSEGMRDSRAAMHLLAEVGDNAVLNGLGPVEGLSLAMVYGMIVGVLLEKERVMRQKRLVV